MNIHDEAKYKWSEGNETFQWNLNYLGFSMEIFHLLVSFLDPLACLELDPVSGSVPDNVSLLNFSNFSALSAVSLVSALSAPSTFFTFWNLFYIHDYMFYIHDLKLFKYGTAPFPRMIFNINTQFSRLHVPLSEFRPLLLQIWRQDAASLSSLPLLHIAANCFTFCFFRQQIYIRFGNWTTWTFSV